MRKVFCGDSAWLAVPYLAYMKTAHDCKIRLLIVASPEAISAATLLIEHMRVQNDLLPTLSPAKATTYATFQRVLLHIEPGTALHVEQDSEVDGVGALGQGLRAQTYVGIGARGLFGKGVFSGVEN